MSKRHSALRNMKLVIAESAATAALLSVPIMTPFYLSLGLSQEEIALTQMAFTAAVMLLNLPLGWVADRFSRKWANVAGDLLGAISLLFYATVSTFWTIVFCEILFGVGCALSQGVDSTLLKHFCEKEDSSGKLFKNKYAKMASYREVTTLFILLLGGPIGAISFRLAIALSSVTYFVGAILSILIEDDSEKLTASTKNPAKEIARLIKRNASDGGLRARIAAYAVARECTHGIIWVFTPLMLYVGVPLEIVSVGWTINYIAAYLGTQMARRFAPKMSKAQIFLAPVVIVSAASIVMAINLNAFTVCLYALFGLARGWSGATMMPLIKERVRSTEQSSVESLARVISQLLYIVAVWLINRAADVQLQYALVATVAIFAPLAIPIALRLRKE